MNADITKFLASPRGIRFVRETKQMLRAQQFREAKHVKLARITNGKHPEYKNGIPYES